VSERRSHGYERRHLGPDDPDSWEDAWRRLKPALQLYEALVPFGIDRYMPLLLAWFTSMSYVEADGRRSVRVWDHKFTRWAAVIGCLAGLTQVVTLGLAIYSALKVK
jgi:hypothetical protein